MSNTAPNKEVTELRKEVAELKAQLLTQANIAGKSAKISKDNIVDFANKAGETARNYLSDKQSQLYEAKGSTEAMIQTRPFSSTAVAFVAGMAITALFSRK